MLTRTDTFCTAVGITEGAILRHVGFVWLQELSLPLLCCSSCTQGGVQGIPHARMPFRIMQQVLCSRDQFDCRNLTGLCCGIRLKKNIKRDHDQDQILLPLLHGSGAELSRRTIVPDRDED